jgi:AhpD family alkylhydroperoxidase
MARVEELPSKRLPFWVRLAHWYSRRKYGRIPGPVHVFSHHPTLLSAVGAYELCQERAHKVDPVLKSLAEVIVAMRVGCSFCVDIGSAMGRAKGITEAQLRDLNHYADSSAFSSLEKSVLRYAEAMTATPAVVPESMVSELRKHLDPAQLVELTAAIAWENHRARFNDALGIPAEGYSEGAFCPLPARPQLPPKPVLQES